MDIIKDGEYVRTIFGTITKIKDTEFDINYNMLDTVFYKHWCINDCIKEQITKHSKNIIDLIEVGDYVNEKLVTNVDKIDNKNFIEWEDGNIYSTEIKNDKFIKTILTKELFKNFAYKVDDIKDE